MTQSFDPTPYEELVRLAAEGFLTDTEYAVSIAEDAALLRSGGDPGKWNASVRCKEIGCSLKAATHGRGYCGKHRQPHPRPEPYRPAKKPDASPIWLSSIPRVTIGGTQTPEQEIRRDNKI